MRPTDSRRVLDLAAPREGVISRQLLVRAGLDHELPSREIAASRWQPVLPGIYLTTSSPITFRQRCHAALLHGGSKAVLTGNAGCRLLGLPGARYDDDKVDVLVPQPLRRKTTAEVNLIRSRRVPQRSGDPAQGELPVASAVRCIADVVRCTNDLAVARTALCAAVDHADVGWEALSAEASFVGPGGRQLSRVLRDLEDGVRSAPEGELHEVLFRAARRGQLPPYLLNPDLYVDGVFLGSPDVWIVGQGLGEEMDSRQWHESVPHLDATLLRHEAFAAHGLHLNHTTPFRFRSDPRGHLAKLVGLVEHRRTLARPEPPGLVVLARGPLLPDRRPWPQVSPSRLGLGSFRRQAAA